MLEKYEGLNLTAYVDHEDDKLVLSNVGRTDDKGKTVKDN